MKIVVLNSGGFDSTVLLNELWYMTPAEIEIHSLFFSYGQKNLKMERECAEKNAKLKCDFHKEIEIPKIDWSTHSFYGEDVIDAPEQYLEMRNMIFLSYATSYAQAIGADKIYVAFLKSHYYMDTSEKFLRKMNALTKIAGVKVIAPFKRKDKENLQEFLVYFDIGCDDFFSCNIPVGDKPCGVCGDCRILEAMFEGKRILQEALDNPVKKTKRLNFPFWGAKKIK